MVVWKLVLTVLSAVVLGVISGVIVVRLTRRREESATLIPNNSTPIGFQSTNPSVSYAEDRLELLMRERQKIAANIKYLQHENTELLKELRHNLIIATSPFQDKLLPFQTDYWDNNQGTLVDNHKEELIEVYTDIRLANIIVWLSNEVGHLSLEMEQGYQELCIKIADNLKKVTSA
jgi:hypothetical protein